MTASKIKIISWNVAGLRAVIRKGSLNELLSKEKPDIICLQEIKCLEGDIPSKFIKEMDELGYTMRLYNSAERKGYSGTAIFAAAASAASAASSFEPEKIATNKIKDNEGRLMIYDFGKFILINMYVPNAKPDLSRLKERISIWEAGIRETLVDLEKKYKKPIIITGDLNVAPEEIDLKNYEANRGHHGFTDEERQAFRDLLKTGSGNGSASGYIDIFRELHPTEKKYTWFSPFGNARKNNVGWRIDMFIINKKYKKKIETADILSEYTGSDHIPIVLELNI
uniref:Endonuclease/exonuclease/phosphatase domain-containing protein n=1 Tax=viral metagenome TaxID=1070528 RepID=A0A6C0KWX4_9ZZZZ